MLEAGSRIIHQIRLASHPLDTTNKLFQRLLTQLFCLPAMHLNVNLIVDAGLDPQGGFLELAPW